MYKRIILLRFIVVILLAGCNFVSIIPASTKTLKTEITSQCENWGVQTTSTSSSTNQYQDSIVEIFKVGLIKEQQHILGNLNTLTRYDIHIYIPTDYSTLLGEQTVIYTNTEVQPLQEIYFRLFPNANGGEMLISNVFVENHLVEPSYEFNSTAIRIRLSQPLIPNTSLKIKMDFTVKIPRVMGGNYGLFGYFDQVLVLDEFYPLIPVFDDEGWNVEEPPLNGDLTYLDVSYYTVKVTAPKDLVIVASGNAINSLISDDEQVVTFQSVPSRDFYIAASNQFISLSENIGETKVSSYTFQEYSSSAEFALRVASDALKSYNQRFGTYPYTEYDVVSTPMKALGIEYPGIVGIGLSMYAQNKDTSNNSSLAIFESVIAHETAHQWFYNVVGNDQVDEPWMDEAIVQYITALYFLDTYGQSAKENYQRSWYERWDRVNRADFPVGLPSSQYTQQEYSPIVYGRGPIFLDTLADQIGQETMDTSLMDYFQTYAWEIGNSDAFKQILENHCECDLTPIFNTWIYP